MDVSPRTEVGQCTFSTFMQLPLRLVPTYLLQVPVLLQNRNETVSRSPERLPEPAFWQTGGPEAFRTQPAVPRKQAPLPTRCGILSRKWCYYSDEGLSQHVRE